MIPVHGVVIHESPVALQVELAKSEHSQSNEWNGEDQAQERVWSTTALCNTGEHLEIVLCYVTKINQTFNIYKQLIKYFTGKKRPVTLILFYSSITIFSCSGLTSRAAWTSTHLVRKRKSSLSLDVGWSRVLKYV